MPEWAADAEVLARVTLALQSWRQGDIASPGVMVHVADAGNPLTHEATVGVAEGERVHAVEQKYEQIVVLTQTCDVVRSPGHPDHRPFVQVAPLVRLKGDELAQARKSPRYAPVPGGGVDAFADLDICTTMEKSVLAGLERIQGCSNDDDARSFGRAAGRHRGRFAFPNDVNLALDKLRKRMVSKTGRDSPEGRRVDEVLQIRAAATPDWRAIYDLDLTFIVDEGRLAAVSPDDPLSDEIQNFASGVPAIAAISAQIEDASLSAADRSYLWQLLVERWCELCSPTGQVRSIAGTAESADVLPFAAIYRTEQLDLDFLSEE